MVRLGQLGEGLAAAFLKKQGYSIIKQNYKTHVGEIDIIAKESDVLVFIEVKTRESLEYGHPFESVHKKKIRKIANAANLYLKQLKVVPACRFDVVSVYYEHGRPEFELIKDAFEV